MLVNYLDKLEQATAKWKWVHSSWFLAIILPLWVLGCLALSVAATAALIYILGAAGVSLRGLNDTVFSATVAAIIYAFTLLFAIGIPGLFGKRTSLKQIGLSRWPSWMDILLSPAGFIVYFIASSLLVYIASQTISGFDISQTQETGFTRLTQYYEYALAFITLIVVAPVAEEVLFRGFLYGKLRRRMPVWVAVLITSALFGFVHGQWNVGLDVFALSIVLCSLREITGSIWSGILLHMLKNSVAFFILFISPML